MVSNFKDLLNDIRCGRLASPAYSEVDLANVKACLPEPIAPLSKYTDVTAKAETSCVNSGLSEIQRIVKEQMDKQVMVIELGLLKGKIEELLDHYRFISEYYKTRDEFFNDTLSSVETFTSDYLYWDSESTRLKAIEALIYKEFTKPDSISSFEAIAFKTIYDLPDASFELIEPNFSNLSKFVNNNTFLLGSARFSAYYNARSLRIQADKSRLVASNGATKALASKIDGLKALDYTLSTDPDTKVKLTATQLEITNLVENYSGQIYPYFLLTDTQLGNGRVIPAKVVTFDIKQINLNRINTVLPKIEEDGSSSQVEKRVEIRKSQYLTTNFFKDTVSTQCVNLEYEEKDARGRLLKYSKPELIPGLLYNSYGDYEGLYKRLSNPIEYLYSAEERGLTTDPSLVDPNLKDAPLTIKVGDIVLYIKNQEKYEAFYETLNQTLPAKIIQERSEVIPRVLQKPISELKAFARREVADLFRSIENPALRLARPVSYRPNSSSRFTQGTFRFDSLDKVLSAARSYYQKANDGVLERIKEGELELKNLDKLINDSSLNEEDLTKRVSNIACFKKVANLKLGKSDCESAVMAKLGTDPLNLRTLNGTDAKLPTISTPCYWREFANSLNKISLLPVPDLSSPLFRYYPVNNIIPTPLGIVLIPIPQKWKTLFVLPSALGTLVAFIVMPVAIVGIPLPSIYVFYISPDGKKYMIIAPNFTVLYAPPFPINYGFEPDYSSETNNPTGLNQSDPFKGSYVKGAFTTPLSLIAKSEKAKRVTSALSDIALGGGGLIKNRKGETIGKTSSNNIIENYTSTFEKMLGAADSDTSNDFKRQVKSFKRDINRQFDKLGEMQINEVTKLKELTRKKRQSEVLKADKEPDSKNRRDLTKLARKIDPITLNEKISSVLSDFNSYIDKIQLGTIKFPDDPTKLNPKLPSQVSAASPVIEHVSKGGAQTDNDSKNLIAKIKRFASQVDSSKLKSKKKFDLEKNEDVVAFKKAIKEYCDEALSFLQGDKVPADNPEGPLSEEELLAAKRSADLRKKRLKTALAFTALSVSPPKLKLFDPAAPCCETTEDVSETLVSPQVQAAISVFIILFDEILAGLTKEDLRRIISDSSRIVGIESISPLFNEILAGIPKISLPEKPDIFSLSQAILFPVLSAITIPQAPNPLGIPFPIQISIPMDVIVKPILKASTAYVLELILRLLSDASDLLNSANSVEGFTAAQQIIRQIPCGNDEFAEVTTTNLSNKVTVTLPNGFKLELPKVPMVALDLIQYFALLTSTDLVELVRNIILTAIDGILIPLENIVTPILGLTRTLKDLSFNIIEASNPFILPIKLAMMGIQLAVPNSTKMRIANLAAIDLLNASYIPILKASEPVLKEIAYLGSIAACALIPKEGVRISRIASSPFFNQDDLPPWERLTHKNPLFAIFLDEIAWRSSITSTGSLIFQTKNPSFYPTAWSPTIFGSDPGYH